MNIYDIFILPAFNASDDILVSEDNTNKFIKYPLTHYNSAILDTNINNFNTISSKFLNPSQVTMENNNVIYNFNNFNAEEPYTNANNATLRSRSGDFTNVNELNYELNAPSDGGLALVGQVYRYNSNISNWNGGVITNNGNNNVVYKQIISNIKYL